MTTTRTRAFFETPTHGYLRVPMAEIERLGIRNMITRYSYHCENLAFLEEDCDLATYVEAMEAAGYKIKLKVSQHSGAFLTRAKNFESATEGPYKEFNLNRYVLEV